MANQGSAGSGGFWVGAVVILVLAVGGGAAAGYYAGRESRPSDKEIQAQRDAALIRQSQTLKGRYEERLARAARQAAGGSAP